MDDFFKKYADIRSRRKIAGDGHKYELYVYCKVLDALRRNSFALHPRALQKGGRFFFRCNPGVIRGDFSYFDFTSGAGTIL